MLCLLGILGGYLRDQTGRVRDTALRNHRKLICSSPAGTQERADAAVAAGVLQHAYEAAGAALILNGGQCTVQPTRCGVRT